MDDPTANQLYDHRSTAVAALTGGTYSYRLMQPAKRSPGEKFPLIVYLHGIGERGSDNLAQLRFLPTWMAAADNREKYPCYLLAPQCRDSSYWVETPRAHDRHAPRAAPGPMMQAVIAAIDDALANFSIDPTRMYLTGLSMGGFGSWDLGTREAERWAAVVPICGGGDELYADRLANVPVWAWHGDADDVVPVSRSRVMIEAIRAAGGSPRYTELAGVGHDSWTPAYHSRELLDWTFSQRKTAE
jgi:predicted peptidase